MYDLVAYVYEIYTYWTLYILLLLLLHIIIAYTHHIPVYFILPHLSPPPPRNETHQLYSSSSLHLHHLLLLYFAYTQYNIISSLGKSRNNKEESPGYRFAW